MEENDICIHNFFTCWNKMLHCRQMKAEVRINLHYNNVLIKSELARADRQFSFELHLLYQCWSCWICVLLYLCSIRKNISFSNLYLLYFKCSMLKQTFRIYLISFLRFFQITRLFINRVFMNSFLIKISKLSIGSLIIGWDNWNIFPICFEQLRENSGSLKTINISFNFLWSPFIIHGYNEERINISLSQFVTITLKRFLSQFLLEKAVWNFAQSYYQRLALNTKKSVAATLKEIS